MEDVVREINPDIVIVDTGIYPTRSNTCVAQCIAELATGKKCVAVAEPSKWGKDSKDKIERDIQKIFGGNIEIVHATNGTLGYLVEADLLFKECMTSVDGLSYGYRIARGDKLSYTVDSPEIDKRLRYISGLSGPEKDIIHPEKTFRYVFPRLETTYLEGDTPLPARLLILTEKLGEKFSYHKSLPLWYTSREYGKYLRSGYKICLDAAISAQKKLVLTPQGDMISPTIWDTASTPILNYITFMYECKRLAEALGIERDPKDTTTIAEGIKL